VPYIPDQLVIGRIINIMNGGGKFYHPQTCPEMPSVNAYYIDDILPKFIAQLRELLGRQFFEVCRTINLPQ
jgi:hypothetical protein